MKPYKDSKDVVNSTVFILKMRDMAKVDKFIL